jgi:hypothetical protein
MKRYLLCATFARAAGLLSAGPTAAHAEQYLIVAKGKGFSDGFDRAVRAAGGHG